MRFVTGVEPFVTVGFFDDDESALAGLPPEYIRLDFQDDVSLFFFNYEILAAYLAKYPDTVANVATSDCEIDGVYDSKQILAFSKVVFNHED